VQSVLILTKCDKNNIIGLSKNTLKTDFSVNDLKSSKTLQRFKRISRCTLISG